jgi:hypothetical protein
VGLRETLKSQQKSFFLNAFPFTLKLFLSLLVSSANTILLFSLPLDFLFKYHPLLFLIQFALFSAVLSPPPHCKKNLTNFPTPAGMTLTKLSLAGNNLIIPGQGDIG